MMKNTGRRARLLLHRRTRYPFRKRPSQSAPQAHGRKLAGAEFSRLAEGSGDDCQKHDSTSSQIASVL